MLIVDKRCSDVCCDEFLVSQIDGRSKQEKNSDMENFTCSGERLAVLNNEYIKICG